MFDKLVVSVLVDEVVGGFFINVPPGHAACVFDRGRGVLKKIWGPGLHLKVPFWQIAKLFNVQTLEYNIRKGFDLSNGEALGDEPLNAVTQDNKLITIEGTILFRVQKERLPELWETIGERFVSKIIRPVSRSRIRSVIAQYAMDAIRTNFRKEIEGNIQEELEKVFAPKGLIVEGVLLSEIKPLGD
ncbi:MAG: prohibitin family protein [Candidatus Cloacimonetes bacterium]|nr:prohibitin family protein [Candidatus Cloacimonadota bacterium]